MRATLTQTDYSTVKWRHRVVRGQRSDGAQSIAFYVSTKYEASVVVGNMLIDVFSGHNALSADLHFYFFDEPKEEVKEEKEGVVAPTLPPLPLGFVRAAVVLQIASVDSRQYCVQTFGRNGKQPNRDLAALFLGRQTAGRISYICEDERKDDSGAARLHNFVMALRASVRSVYVPSALAQLSAVDAVAITSAPGPPVPLTRAQTMVLPMLVDAVQHINNLEEDFHHAAHAWMPVSVIEFVPFAEQLQMCIILGVASTASNIFAALECYGTDFAAAQWAVLAAGFPAGLALRFGGTVGCALVSLASCLLCSRLRQDSYLLLAVAAATLGSLSIGFQPAFGLLGGAGAAAQLLFLWPYLGPRWRHAQLLLGTVVSWAVVAAVRVWLQVPLGQADTYVSLFYTTCLYGNAVWVTGRLLHHWAKKHV